MYKFRKKPVIIHAARVTEQQAIETLEGTMTANPGDWIIAGVKGERYPVKDDIFRATYEPAEIDAERALKGLPIGPGYRV